MSIFNHSFFVGGGFFMIRHIHFSDFDFLR